MSRSVLFAAVFAGVACSALPAIAGAQVGALTCDSSASIATIILQRQDLRCTFTPVDGGPEEYYRGRIDAWGIALGAVVRGKLAWAVLAPSRDLPHGVLSGTYRGLSVQASFGGGGAANVLVGDFDNTVSLQPLALQGAIGVNAVAGIASLTLTAAPERRPRRFWDRWDD